MKDFKLRFGKRQIAHWADRHREENDETDVSALSQVARSRGYLTPRQFLRLCYWKSPRTQSRCARNPDDRVRDATRLALGTTDNRAKIGILRLLDGVDWPTASVILHFCDPLPYPILDYRARWSLGYRKPPPYTFEFWMAYVGFTRELSRSTGHSMRTVDRALWQYSKENQ